MANSNTVSALQLTANPKAERQGRNARLIVWLAFVTALFGALYASNRAVDRASLQVSAMARDVQARLENDEKPAELVASLVASLYGESADGKAVANYETALRALAYKLGLERRVGPRSGADDGAGDSKQESAATDPKEPAVTDPRKPAVSEEGPVAAAAVRRAVQGRYWAVWLLVAVLVMTFPMLYDIRVRQAIRELTATQDPPDYWSAAWYHRSKYFLSDEAAPHLFRRFGFAALISASTLFLLAPGGLQSSVIGEYARSISVPGGLSYPFWFTEMIQASPFVIGLTGYLLYSLTVFTRRALTRDISNRLFLALWNRGLVVVILSLVLTGIDDDSNISRALVFVAGVFPQTGIAAIGKVAEAGADRLARLEPAGFSEVPEIDLLKETSLQELGIYDVHDLAAANVAWLQEASGLEPRVLLRAVDRALLLHHFEAPAVEKLTTLPAMTASGLVLFVHGRDAYMDRWKEQGADPPHPIGKQLTEAERDAQLAKVNAALGVQDASVLLEVLCGHRNVVYILDNRVMYPDI